MIDLSILNNPQRQACEQIEGPVLVLAGAGTGKTRVITFRIALMLSLGISPESIVAITFTNKASREMSERLAAIIGAKTTRQLALGTFHSFCLKILREFGEKIDLPARFTLAGTSDQQDLLARAIKEEKFLSSLNIEMLHSLISGAKNKLMSPFEFGRSCAGGTAGLDEDSARLCYELYERQLKLNRMIDFDDCIYKTVVLLESCEDVKKTLQERYKYFLVDEFQDTNAAQLRILELLASRHKNICVVGDDDQSIYSWRGAMYETLERFEEIFTGTKLIKLEQNYRCTGVILKAANSVIKNNDKRKDKELWSQSDIHFPVALHFYENEEAEAKEIALKIMSLLGEGYQPKDVAVLYRANNQARLIELALRELRISYETFGGSSFFERKEVKDFLSYMRLIANPQDRLAFWRIINTPHRGIGIKSLEKIEAFTLKSQRSPFQESKENSAHLGLGDAIRRSLDGFIQEIDLLNQGDFATPEDVENLGIKVIKAFGLAQDIRETTKDENSKSRKLEILNSLPKWMGQCASDAIKENGRLDWRELFDKLTLNDRDISDGHDDETKKAFNKVSLMTVHASKGLEFPCVFVTGLEEDLFPHKNSVSSKLGVSEERRLFYVAITRAKHKLILTSARERGVGPMKSLRLPSRFLQEIPPDVLTGDSIGNSKSQEDRVEEKKTKILSSFASLRQSLKSP